jgi:hypothetical protein
VGRLQHFPRYLKAASLRLDKLRADPARDARLAPDLAALEVPYRREAAIARRQGALRAEFEQFGWLLEELRVSLFAQELKTPVPVPAKRLSKLWQTLNDERRRRRCFTVFANLFHPRMLWLMIWPMLVSLALWGSVALVMWTRARVWLAELLEPVGARRGARRARPARHVPGERGPAAAVRAAGLPDGAFHPRRLRHAGECSSTSRAAPIRSSSGAAAAARSAASGTAWSALAGMALLALGQPAAVARAAAVGRCWRWPSWAGATSGCCATTPSPSMPTLARCRPWFRGRRMRLYIMGVLLALIAYVPLLGLVAPVAFGLGFIHYLLGALAAQRIDPG